MTTNKKMPSRLQKYLLINKNHKNKLNSSSYRKDDTPISIQNEPNSFLNFKSLQEKTYMIYEGSVSNDEVEYITKFLKEHRNIKKIMEIGFNGGLSCAAMLLASDEINIISFDIGEWDYVEKAKELIAKQFPNRHQLVIGDSTITLPKYDTNQYGTFDLIFLDGGHQKPVPELDITNSLKFLKKEGYIFMDDYCDAYGTGGVIEAYDKAVSKGLIKTVEGPFNGEGGRGWIVAQKC